LKSFVERVTLSTDCWTCAHQMDVSRVNGIKRPYDKERRVSIVVLSHVYPLTSMTYELLLQKRWGPSLTLRRPLLPYAYSYKASCASHAGLSRHL